MIDVSVFVLLQDFVDIQNGMRCYVSLR